MTDSFPPLLASDLRQYVYCPRIVYYRYCVPVHPPPTFKMVEGRLQHERVEQLEHRRTLRAYGLADGERAFHVALASDVLGISGTMDMVIVRRHEVIPVEFKHTVLPAPRTRPVRVRAVAGPAPAPDDAEPDDLDLAAVPVGLHHKYQLAAYALLAEERWRRPGRRCFVYFVPARRAIEVAIADGARRYVRRLLGEMRRLIVAQRIPPPTRRIARCRECEYLRFCNDVDL